MKKYVFVKILSGFQEKWKYLSFCTEAEEVFSSEGFHRIMKNTIVHHF